MQFTLKSNESKIFTSNQIYEEKSGGAMEDRTPDLRVANAALYQLSYDPNRNSAAAPRREGRT